MATTEPPKSTRRKRRWGDGPDDNGGDAKTRPSKRKSRFSSTPPSSDGGNGAPRASSSSAAADPKARAAALQASIQARLAALKARTGGGASAVAVAVPTPTPAAATSQKAKRERSPPDASAAAENDEKATKRARVFELDMTSTAPMRLLEKRQRDERLRSSATAMTTTGAKPREAINPYLTHAVESELATASAKSSSKGERGSAVGDAKTEEILLDTRLAPSQKNRMRSRPLSFVAPGTYIALGEKKRQQAARAEESGYVSGRKVGNVVKSVGMGVGGVVSPVVSATVEEVGAEGMAAKGAGGEGSYYGAGEAGKVIERRLPARVDAPELELEDFVGGKKKILTSISDVDVEKNDAAVSAALNAATSSMPYAMEWWDAELLPSKLRKELAGEEGKAIASRAKKQGGLAKKDVDGNAKADGSDASRHYSKKKQQHSQLIQKCYQHASLTHSKTHALVQHPVPILTPAQRAAREAARNKPPTLHLTKAERKRHRKLRRAQRLREQQDMQAAGLVPPPEPRLTLSNYVKVLGDQAVLDPSRMEAVVMEQIQARRLKHEKMNAERKLTKEQRAEKHARKLQEDTSQSVRVALFYVKDMSHPYHRAKVDLNAQQNSVTGGVLECDEGGINLVVAEGGEKALKRYTRLMTVRMRWRGEDFYEEDEESEEELMVGEDDEGKDASEGKGGGKTREKRKKFNPENECELIWSGMAVKRAFHSFMFQSAQDSVVARKILEAKGVAHYWDLAAGHVERKCNAGDGVGGVGVGDGALRFRLGDGGSEDGAGGDNMMK